MTPAEELAFLKAVAHGLEAAIEHKEAEVLSVMRTSGADRFRTEIGSVSKTIRRPRIDFQDQQLLKFAEEHAPWEIETRVRRTFYSQFEIADGAVIYKPTGEQVDFATIRPGAEGLTTRLTTDIKESAAGLLLARVDALPRLLELEGVNHETAQGG